MRSARRGGGFGRLATPACCHTPGCSRKVGLGKVRPLCYTQGRSLAPIPGSSVVEQPAVNRLVAGSNPARGAKRPLRRRSQTIPYNREIGKSP